MAVALLCAPLVYPWYLVWFAPFLVSPQTVPLTIWTVSILSTYVVWQLAGVPWAVPEWVLLVEYGALIGAALWLWDGQRARWGAELSSPPAPHSPGAP